MTLNGQLLHTLLIANDNDFVPGLAGANQFYVFGFQDSDLPGFAPQRFSAPVPEPGTWATMLMGMGLVGGMIRRKRRAGGVVAE